MFFVLSKLLEFLITPVCWVFGLLLAGIFVKKQPLKKRLLISCAIVFYFFSNSFIASEVMDGWEIPAVSDSTLRNNYDVAIVLSGFVDYDAKLDRIQFEHGGDRLFQAYRLYKQGRVKKICIDGGSGNLGGINVEAPEIQRYLLKIGVPDSAILIEPRSRNTHENALFVKPILDSAMKKSGEPCLPDRQGRAESGRYLLITSAYHERRAIGCFNREGIKVTPYSTDRAGGPLKFEIDYVFIPDLHALLTWNVLIHEWIGYATYKIAGYI